MMIKNRRTNSSRQPFTFAGRLRSFRHAFTGVRELVASQHNAWIHALATGGVVGAGWGLGVSRTQWCLLILAISLVWVTEALNTAFESLCDVVSPEFHPAVRKAKDIAAGAVLLSALGSIMIGLLVFAPYLIRLV